MKQIKIIYGSESYLIAREQETFMAGFRSENESADIETFGKDAVPAQVAEALQNTSLFGGASVVVWQDCPLLPVKRGGRSRSKLTKEEDWFLKQLPHIPDGNGLLFVTKLDKGKKLDTGCIFFKKIADLADVAECQPVTEKTVMSHVNGWLKERGYTLSLAAGQYLRALFQTWETIPLMYVFSELEKLSIMMPEGVHQIEEAQLAPLFAGSMEKNLFTFMDYFLRRDGQHTLPFVAGLFARQDVFLKNTGYMLSRLRLLRGYKELRAAHMSERQCEQVLTKLNRGKPVRYALYHLKKAAPFWTVKELDELMEQIFYLQFNIRRGVAVTMDMEPVICLYCRRKGRD